MDGVQLSQDYRATEAFYFLPLSSQKFLVLIWSASEIWKAELTLEPGNYWFQIFVAEIDFAREFHGNSISGSMKNGERMVQVIQVTERILLLPWFQQIMIQVIQRYETNGFLVFRVVRSLVSLIQVSKQIDP